ncbi:hypothetical protein GCM10028801_37430 [Nocardioides maradonensis]
MSRRFFGAGLRVVLRALLVLAVVAALMRVVTVSAMADVPGSSVPAGAPTICSPSETVTGLSSTGTASPNPKYAVLSVPDGADVYMTASGTIQMSRYFGGAYSTCPAPRFSVHISWECSKL